MMNTNLRNDPIWQGRFTVTQVESPTFFVYPDKSGADLYVTLQITDKETGDYINQNYTVNEWCGFGGSKLWWFVNNAIIKWREEYDF